jgi:transposase
MSLIIPSKNIWVAQTPIDFRRSIDGLCAYILEYFEAQPQEGLYVFYNVRRNRLKLLVWHHNGFMLLYKRLEHSRFPFNFSTVPGRILIQEKQLQGLLVGLDWQSITAWEEINFQSYF